MKQCMSSLHHTCLQRALIGLSLEVQADSEESPFLRLLAVVVKVELHVALHDILASCLCPTYNIYALCAEL